LGNPHQDSLCEQPLVVVLGLLSQSYNAVIYFYPFFAYNYGLLEYSAKNICVFFFFYPCEKAIACEYILQEKVLA
jgi:hypothetical protein